MSWGRFSSAWFVGLPTITSIGTILLLFSLTSVAFADRIISDTEFNPNDWQATVYRVVGDPRHSEEQQLDGGNPGAFRYMTHTLPSPSHIAIFHLFLPDSFDPSTEGAISSLDYGEDQIEFDPPFPGAAIGALPALLQDGVIFVGPDFTYTNVTWLSRQGVGLTALDFSSADLTHPDFSASGGIIFFGFLRSNTNNPGGDTIVTAHGIDNWSFTIHTGSP